MVAIGEDGGRVVAQEPNRDKLALKSSVFNREEM